VTKTYLNAFNYSPKVEAEARWWESLR